MKEIRIYYECLEQAAHFIKPILETTDEFRHAQFSIKLIKLIGDYKKYSKNIAKIIFLKDSDILISIIENDVEYPLFQLEISTAVFTEDHELQRFDGIIASIENNCLYGKLSPLNKSSSSKHGGNVDFNYITSYAAIYERYGIMSYHFDWDCNKGNVIVDENYLSCPTQNCNLEIFLKVLISFAMRNQNYEVWINEFEKEILKVAYFSSWKDDLEKFDFETIIKQKTTRIEWDNKNKTLHIKFNRFGHAMDPERGMLAFYGTVFSSVISKMIFDINIESWFKAVSQEGRIRQYIEEKGLKNTSDYLQIFVWATSLFNNDDFMEILKTTNSSSNTVLEVDLTSFVTKNFYLVNKPLRIIFRYSKEFHIYDNEENLKIRFYWKFDVMSLDYSNYSSATYISNRTCLDEDDVTYVCVHNIFIENGYKLLAVSYPGAQGDRVALDDSEKGRSRSRKYVDIIGYFPSSHTNIQENKGPYKKTEVEEAIRKIQLYKTEEFHIKSIERMIEKFDNNAPRLFKLGIGFWANKKFTTDKLQEITVDELDYFIYINSEMSEWKVFSSSDKKLFTRTNGQISMPATYEIISKDQFAQTSFF